MTVFVDGVWHFVSEVPRLVAVLEPQAVGQGHPCHQVDVVGSLKLNLLGQVGPLAIRLNHPVQVGLAHLPHQFLVDGAVLIFFTDVVTNNLVLSFLVYSGVLIK